MATGSVCVRCAVTNSEAVNSLNDRMAANSQPLTRPGSSSGRRHGRQHAARRRAEAGGRELEPLVEIAQRDVDAAQHEGQHQHDVADDHHRKAARRPSCAARMRKPSPTVKCGITSGDKQHASIAA